MVTGQSKHSIVIMDDVSIYSTDLVAHYTINAAGALIRFLPPYSPDMNPIDSVLVKLNTIYRQTASCMSPSSILLMTFKDLVKLASQI